jgi:hypothetical protein
MEERVPQLERQLETMLGIQAGLVVVASALIAQHQDHEQLQLRLSTLLEVFDQAPTGRL